MGQRQFESAHDRLLEPPELENEDGEFDEDAERDRIRQRRLDEEDWIARKIERDGDDQERPY